MVDEIQQALHIQTVLLQPHPAVQPLPQIEEQVVHITLQHIAASAAEPCMGRLLSHAYMPARCASTCGLPYNLQVQLEGAKPFAAT